VIRLVLLLIQSLAFTLLTCFSVDVIVVQMYRLLRLLGSLFYMYVQCVCMPSVLVTALDDISG